MSTPYNAGQKTAGFTDAPPSDQTLKNLDYSDTSIGEFHCGYKNGKK